MEIIEDKLGIPADYQFKAIKSKNLFQSNWHRNKFIALEQVLNFNRHQNILDLGAGSGNFEMIFHNKVKQITALDYNKKAISFLRKRLHKNRVKNVRLLKGDIRNLSKLGLRNKYDLIILVDVIEHISFYEAREMLKSLPKLLQPNGQVCVITPNYKSTWRILEYFLDRFTSIPNLAHVQHLARFNRILLSSIFIRNKFSVKSVHYFNLFSYLLPSRKISAQLCKWELDNIKMLGNLLLGVFEYDPETHERNLNKWNRLYSTDQEGLYDNKFVKYIFNWGSKYVLSRIEDKKGRILDVGCGIAQDFVNKASESDVEYICLDKNKQMLKKIKRSDVRKIVGYAENIPMRSKSVDVIIASHVLEHIKDLEMCFKEFARVLKNKGEVVAVIPCDPGLLWDLLTLFSPSRGRLRKKGLDYNFVMGIEHVNHFTEILIKIKDQFKVVDESYFPLVKDNHDLNILCGITFRKN